MPRHTEKGQAQNTELLAFVLKEWEADSDPAPLLERVHSVPGVQRAEFNPKAKRLIVLGDYAVDDLKALLAELGHELVEEDDKTEEKRSVTLPSLPVGELKRRMAGASEWARTLLWLVPASFLIGVLLSVAATLQRPPAWVLAGLGILLLGTGLFLGAIRLFRDLPRLPASVRTDTVLLLSILLIALTLMGAWLEAGLVLLCYAVVFGLPLLARRRFDRLWHESLGLLPASVRVMREKENGEVGAGPEDVVPVGEAAPGDRFLVRAGEVVSLDGRVAQETDAVVSTFPVTGESLPYIPTPGSLVPAGSILESGELLLVCERPFHESLFFGLRPQDLLAESEAELLQGRVARSLEALPQIIVYAATIIMIVPPLFLGEAIQPWMNRGLAFLLLAPVNTLLFGLLGPPLALRVRLAELGVAPAGWEQLRILGRMTRLLLTPSFIIDPRQTLTAIEPCSSITEQDALRLAASLMQGVDHPFAVALAEAAEGEGLELMTPLRLSRFDGSGIEGTVRHDDASWDLAVGTTSWMQRRGVVLPEEATVAHRDVPKEGVTILWLAYKDRALAAFILQSRMRDGSRRFVQRLRKAGAKRIELLTSAERAIIEGFVRDAGLDGGHADLSPEGMEELLASWQEAGEHCVVVGLPRDGALPSGEHLNVAFQSDTLHPEPEGTLAVIARDTAQLYPVLLVARRGARARRWALAAAFLAKAILFLIALSAAPSLWCMALIEAAAALLVLLVTFSLWRKV